MMGIVDMAIQSVVCLKSDFHRNSDFQIFQKLHPLLVQAKTNSSQKYASLSKIIWC
jgi:hypothetical protein